MTNFTFHNPTKIYFGKHSICNLSGALLPYGKKVLLVYGGGSIKKNGIYKDVVSELRDAGKTIFELPEVMPNPRVEKVHDGIRLCKMHDIDFVLAVGGGSVIDCAKFIAAGAKLERDFWQTLFIERQTITDALPIGSVLTNAATGSEMDNGGVITNWQHNIKTSYGHPLLQPKFGILDPIYTYSLPKNQMIYGAIDILSHVFEVYFSAPDDNNLSDDFSEAIIKNVIANLNIALKDPTNYSSRANLMWCSSMAINGLIGLSKDQDWQTHQIEHALSAFYDIPHGAGLSIVHPNYLKYTYKFAPDKFARFARNIWGIDPIGKSEEQVALEGIEHTQAYFKKIGAPTTLAEVNIPSESIKKIAATINSGGGAYHKLTDKDIINILNLCAGK